MLETLTGFGDSAVLLPLSAILFLWLLALRPFAAAVALATALTACNGILAVLKMYFFACPPSASLHSPSGHTGFSVMVYGGFAAILATEVRAVGWRVAVIALGAAAIAIVAASRLLLGVHTLIEVVLGGVIGGACLTGFALVYRRNHGAGEWLLPLGLIFIAAAALFSGDQAQIEPYLHRLSEMLGIRQMACAGGAG